MCVHRFSHRHDVHALHPHSRPTLQNKYAHSTLQSLNASQPYSSPAALPVYLHGLTGTAQILSVGDTGVDTDHCFFADPTTPISYAPTTPNFNHRKVVYYDARSGDQADDSDGHGTHVAGSMAGAAQSNDPTKQAAVAWLKEYDGMAPTAKLAIWDFKRVGKNEVRVVVGGEGGTRLQMRISPN